MTRSRAFRPVTTPTADKKAFLEACWRGDTVAVTKAIREGIDPNFSLGGIHKPLVYALQNGQDEILKILLENGASPNTVVEADPILHHAFAAPSKDAVEMLLDHGADPTQPDGSGMNTIVDAAVIGGDDVLVNLAIRLMQEEGGMRRRDLYTEGLHAAVRERNLDLAWKFLNLGADPDYAGPKSIYGLPPMIKAVCLHDKPMIRLLASFGARAGLHTSYIHDTLTEAR